MTQFTGLRDDWRAAPDPQPFRNDDPGYKPDTWVIHWGGGGFYRQQTHAEVASLLRGWRDFHVNTRGWRDIAYNYAAPPQDGSTYTIRLRGENPNGAHAHSWYHGPRTRTYVFYTGPNGPARPSNDQLAAFTRLWVQDPAPVKVHRDLLWQNTTCAGPWLVDWVKREGWLDYEGDRMLAGKNRYDTARKIAMFAFVPPVDLALLALGEAYTPDALAAGAMGAPILYVRKDSIPAETRAALEYLKPRQIEPVSGPSVINAAVVAEARKKYASG